MMTPEIRKRIDDAFATWSKQVMDSQRSDKLKSELVANVKDSIDRLIQLCHKIREMAPLTHSKEWFKWRELGTIEESLFSQGQAIKTLLWIVNLRDTITDVIEYSYGVSFSSLKVYPVAKDRQDDSIIYVLTPKDIRDRNGTISFAKDGKWYYLPVDEFHAKYDEQI